MPDNCVAGVLPAGTINAVAKQTPEGDFVIGVNEGMFFFIEAVADIVSAYFPLGNQPRVALDNSGWAAGLFPALLMCLLGLEDYPPAITDDRSEERKELADQLREIATFFVAAHEYAHVILGHHEGAVKSGAQDLPVEIPLRQVQESEADQLGLILTLAYVDRAGWNLALGYCAADYYFGAYKFIEQFVGGVVRPIERVLLASAARRGFLIRMPLRVRSNTHPPIQGRRWLLSQFMQKIPGNAQGAPTVINHALTQAARTDKFIAAVWGRSRTEFSDQLMRHLAR